MLRRRNPLATLLATAPAAVCALFSRGPMLPAVLGLALLLLLASCGSLHRRTLALFVTALPLGVLVVAFSFALWSDPVSGAGRLFFHLGPWTFTEGQWQEGLSTALRLGAIFCAASVTGATSSARDVVLAATTQLHIPYRIGQTALAGLRMLPWMRHDASTIRTALRLRGRVAARPWRERLDRPLRLPIPLLAASLRRAERLAIAMDARGFGGLPHRTERDAPRWTASDWILIGCSWTITLILVIVTTRA